ncbi:NAD(P) transhydrogenase alpha subunit [Caenispirillum salinarum AK4]|uniref:proton-translocating NAD(P)(+) transhydrogenase n=2 Tax=Caenispirillum TaxID=414051 RepID=K9HSG1_9PROT|nr:NAD(P) transhydrogenase subunit alpha [Caenispirillum salinarum]EKV31276.1 NAD(P) transhydrogenase alpha subunit [Caenispirillum salinarum AK4]
MANQDVIEQGAKSLAEQAEGMAATARALAEAASQMTAEAASQAAAGPSEFYWLLTVFVLAVFVGYYVVWRVTPALHSPLMAVTNAISSVIIVGAMLAAGPEMFSGSKVLGFIAVVLASVNIFGGFMVTQRMLSMFKKKQK